MGDIRRHYVAVVGRAARDTVGFANRQGLIAGLAVAAAGGFANSQLEEEVNFGNVLLSAVLAVLALALLAFLFNAIRAPVLLAHEGEQEKLALAQQLDAAQRRAVADDLLDAVVEFMREGQRIRFDLYTATDYRPELRDPIKPWVQGVTDHLREKAPQFLPEFTHEVGDPSGTNQRDTDLRFMDRRLSALLEIIRELRGR